MKKPLNQGIKYGLIVAVLVIIGWLLLNYVLIQPPIKIKINNVNEAVSFLAANDKLNEYACAPSQKTLMAYAIFDGGNKLSCSGICDYRKDLQSFLGSTYYSPEFLQKGVTSYYIMWGCETNTAFAMGNRFSEAVIRADRLSYVRLADIWQNVSDEYKINVGYPIFVFNITPEGKGTLIASYRQKSVIVDTKTF